MQRSMLVLLVALSACGKPVTPSDRACPAPPRAGGEAPRLLVQDGHSGIVNAMALSGNGRVLASAGMDGTLRIWDTQSGLLLDRLSAPGALYGVALDHDGAVLAYPVANGSAKPHALQVVSLVTGRRVEVAGWGPFALSPDGSKIAVGHRAVAIYDARSGAQLRSIALELAADHDVNALAFDGERVVVALPGELVEIAATTKRTPLGDAADVNRWVSEVIPTKRGVLVKRVDALELVRPDGRIVPVLQGAGQIAAARDKLWSAVSAEKDYSRGLPDEDAGHTLRALGFDGRETLRVALEREPFRMAAAADGSMVVVTYYDAVRGTALQLIDGKTGTSLHTIEGRTSGVDALAMSPDGASLTVGSLAALSFWRLPSAEMWFTTHERRLRGAQALSYDARGLQLASIESGWIRVRSTRTGRLLRAWKHDLGQPSLLAFRPNGELVSGDDLSGAIYRWDLRTLPKESNADPDNLIRPLAAPRGALIVKLDFEIERGALDPSGKHAVVGGREGRVALVDLERGAVVWSIESKTSFGYALAFDAEGKRVLLSGYRYQPPTASHAGLPILRAFDARDGKQLVEIDTPTAGAVAARKEAIAVAGEHPALFDPQDLRLRARLELPDTRFTAVIADARRPSFLFGGAAGSTAIVDLRGRLHAVLVAAPGGDWIATTPDGLYRASIDGARRIAWSYDKPLEAFAFEQFADRFERPDVLEQSIARLHERPMQAPRERPPRVHSLAVDASGALSARVSDARQVSHLRAYVNGRLAATERVCAPQANVRLRVPLDPGANRIAVVAHGPDGLASHARSANVRSTVRATPPSLWVVAVGVSRYGKLPAQYQLDFADDDARAVTRALADLAGRGRPFARAHVRTLIDRQVSATALEDALGALANMAPSDVAVVFLAGHGVRLRDGKMRFLTHDATFDGRGGVGWDVLDGAISRARGRVIVLLDACHSGHVITEPVAPNESLAKALAARGRAGALVFAAARGSEFSYEVGADAGGTRALELAFDGEPPPAARKLATGHGLFTSALLEAFAGRAVDRDRSGALELDEIIGHVSERVRAASRGRQNPWVARRELFGDFALVPVNAPPAKR